MFSLQIGLKGEEMAAVGFGDIEEQVRACVNFHFALLEIVSALEVREEGGEQPGTALTFTMAVVGEDKDSSSGRPQANIVKIMLGYGDARPEPVEEDGYVELFAFQEVAKAPRSGGVVADVAHAVGIVRDYGDAQGLQRRSIAVVVAAVTR